MQMPNQTVQKDMVAHSEDRVDSDVDLGSPSNEPRDLWYDEGKRTHKDAPNEGTISGTTAASSKPMIKWHSLKTFKPNYPAPKSFVLQIPP